MPNMANLRRAQEIREYFRRAWAGRTTDPNDAKDDILSRFGMKKERWYNYVPQFRKIIAETAKRHDNGTLVQELPPDGDSQGALITVPADISDAAKLAFNKLLTENERLTTNLNASQIELLATRSQLNGWSGRLRLLKKVCGDLLEAV